MNIYNNELIINRYPIRKNDKFQGWNAADEHIINYIYENKIQAKELMIIEDEFGVLSLNFTNAKQYVVNDSLINREGIIENYKINNQPLEQTSFLNPFDNFPENIDLIIIKIPKNKLYLEYILNKVCCNAKQNTQIIAGGMIKYMNKSIYSLFDEKCSDVSSSLGWKKSRLIFCKTNNCKKQSIQTNDFSEFDIKISNYPNLFSYNKLDIGTRFLLEHVETKIEKPETIVDLGCANGIIGVFMGLKFPDSKLIFTDINYSAILSAQQTCKLNGVYIRSKFYWSNCLNAIQDNSVDLILCNPPFHDQHKISTLTALEMFKDSKRVLRKNGELIVIGNRHLDYKKLLSKMFYKTFFIKRNAKFDLIRVIR